jgi:hypothetical protein
MIDTLRLLLPSDCKLECCVFLTTTANRVLYIPKYAIKKRSLRHEEEKSSLHPYPPTTTTVSQERKEDEARTIDALLRIADDWHLLYPFVFFGFLGHKLSNIHKVDLSRCALTSRSISAIRKDPVGVTFAFQQIR